MKISGAILNYMNSDKMFNLVVCPLLEINFERYPFIIITEIFKITNYIIFRYELLQRGELKEEDVGIVPDIYIRNQQIDQQLKYVSAELEKYRDAAM